MGKKRVWPHQLTLNDEGLRRSGRKLFTGTVLYGTEDPYWLRREVELREGMKWGRAQEWYRSGGLREDAEFALDVYSGRVRKWREDGSLISDQIYELGLRIESKCWDEAGRLVEDYRIADDDPSYLAVRQASEAMRQRELERHAQKRRR
jgi:hypothetical protein